MSANIAKVLNENLEAIQGFANNNAKFEAYNAAIVEQNNVSNILFGAFKGKPIQNVGTTLLEVNTVEETYYYVANISSGSIEDGNIVLEAKKVNKAEFNQYIVAGRSGDATDKKAQAKITYDSNKRKYTLEIEDANGSSTTFTQQQLDADVVDHIREGLEAKAGFTYDMKGNVLDTSNGDSWRIKFGSDKEYNVQYMELCNPEHINLETKEKTRCF